MNPALATALILLAVLGGLTGLVMSLYNRLVRARNAFQAAFAQIDVQLKRRYDLIPNLVESARGYLAHESQTLEAVIRARDQASQARLSAAGDPSQTAALQRLSQADGSLSGLLGRLAVVVESYPELKADRTVAGLMAELVRTEDLAASARAGYNSLVQDYNQAREIFPAVLLSGLFGFKPASLWTLPDPAQAEVPRFTLGPPSNP
jgi:LemA protein